MPIGIEEYAFPRWIKQKTRYPWVEDKNYVYRNLIIAPRTFEARHNQDATRSDAWKKPGYNPNHDSVSIEQVNTGVDTTQRGFRPY